MESAGPDQTSGAPSRNAFSRLILLLQFANDPKASGYLRCDACCRNAEVSMKAIVGVPSILSLALAAGIAVRAAPRTSPSVLPASAAATSITATEGPGGSAGLLPTLEPQRICSHEIAAQRRASSATGEETWL